MLEKIIFNVLALALFTITFLKLIRKNDTSYIYVLALEFVGLAINFIELFFSIKLSIILKIIIYIFSIIIPGIMLWIEKVKKIDFPELFNVTIAQILSAFGKQEQAKKMIMDFLNKNPNSYIAHKWLAEFYEKEGNYDAAISEYMRVTDIKRNDFVSTYKLCEVLNKNKQNQEAINLLEEILKQKPEYEKASNLLGEIFFEEEMYKEAISVYMSALRYNPGSYDLYYSLGMAYTMINDFQRAKEFYSKAAEINTLAYNAKLNLGQIALIYGDLDEAEQWFIQAGKQEDLEAGSYYYLSQIALLKGDEDKAKNYMNVAVQLDPKVYKQAQRDPVFTPIKEKINPPEENKENEKNKTLSKKEKSVNRHLMKTCILVKNLSKEDIRNAKANRQNEIDIDEKQKE
ncbi:tetratricopeptide TPR_1 repeat-containing protein [Clostridium sp. CAG:567]|jgi:tetratricopeptide (TPR) repeat protein|nr:tetratricopeptide TPR_1 repeat-containing protein [Clostridium sp. CAG:567]